MSGKGVFIWNNGNKYTGDFLNDKRNGFGIFEWVDGRKYFGGWSNGK